MGAGAERIALDIQASANVAEVAKARSEVSALGDTAKKVSEQSAAADAEAAKKREVFNRVMDETKGNMIAAAKAVADLTKTHQASNAEVARAELAFRRYQLSLRSAEQAAYSFETALEREQRRMALLEIEAHRMAVQQEADAQKQVMTRARLEEAARRTDAALEREQRRMALIQAEALEMDAALGRTDTTGATGSFNRLTSKANTAGIAVLFAFESFARGANSAEGPVRAALRSLSLVALALGPEVGIPIAGAAALGDALFEMWSRSEKAARDAQRQFQSTLETLSRGGLSGAAQARQYLYSGDPFAALTGQREGESALQFLGRSGGQVALEREQARLRALRAESDRITHNGVMTTTQQGVERQSLIDQLNEVNKLLAEQDRRLVAIDGVMTPLLAKQQDMARFQQQQLRDAAARREASRLRPEEVPLTIGNLADQERAFGITGRGGLGIRGISSIDLAQQASDRAQRVDATGLGRIRAAAITETPFHAMQVEMEKQIESLAAHTQQRLGSSLAEALATGITAGFASHGIKGAFAAASKALLAGIGGIFIDLGRTYLEYSGIMQALTPLLGNPFTAGFAGAAIGTALIALGAALEGIGQRGAGGGGGYAGSGSTFTPNTVNGAGGTTVIIQTVNPYSREVVAATTYYINRGQMLNTPIIAPPGAPS